jgi:hypothetical protein
MTLEDFAHWWIDEGKPYLPPAEGKVIETDYTLSFPVFRRNGFQVELYMAKPNWETPKHTHSFDSVTIFNGGKMLGRRGVALNENPPWTALEDTDCDIVQPTLPAGQWHQIKATDSGFTFYNVQYWHQHEPTSATMGYTGEPMGHKHGEILNASK